MPQTPQSQSLLANGLTHHLLEWRPSVDAPAADGGAPATALLLHGFMDAAGTFDLLAPSLARAGLRVLAPDLRGFGRGARAPAGSYYYFTDYVADVAAIVRAAVPEGAPLFVVGHSMGGTIASYYTGAFPERVTKLALLEGVGPPDNPKAIAPVRLRRWVSDVDDARAKGQRTRAIASMDDALRRLVANHPKVDIDLLRTRLPHLVLREEDGTLSWAFDPLHKTVSPVPFFAEVYKQFAKEVTCPVLFVGGGAGGYHPSDEDERVAAFASVERVDLPDAGHMMHWTKPRELGDALIAFWSKRPVT
jgi:pimeloyl-ACP methyl ester carboxylesterase